MKKILLHIGVLMLFGIPAAHGQDIEVRATVNETTIGAQEQLIFSIEIAGAGFSGVETPSPPEAEGLALLQSTPSVHRNMTFTNGALEQSVTFRWGYRPLQEGPARLLATSVTVDGKTWETQPLEIVVVDQAQRPQQPQPQASNWPFGASSPTWPQDSGGNDAPAALEPNDLFIRAVPSATTAYQNEQIIVEYLLYFRDGVQLRHSRLAGSWDAEGFWREEFEIDTRPLPENVVENGLLYHTIPLKRVAIFPTRPGTLTVDALEVESEVHLPSGTRSSPFDRLFSLRGQFQPVEIASEPLGLRITPLPGGAPPAFSGAVGVWNVTASVSKTDVEVGEPLHIVVTIQGTGNVATLDEPAFAPPGAFERYEPNIETTINRGGQRIQGRKTFEYVVIPRSNGSFDIPPVTFAWYDPGQDRYVTQQAELPVIRVTGSVEALAAGTTTGGFPIDDIAGILTIPGNWRPVEETPLYRRVWPYAALLFPPGFLLFLYVRRRHADRLSSDTQYARGRIAHPLARKHLRQAGKLLESAQPIAFYEEIERALSGFIGNRLNVPETGWTRDQLDACLHAAGVTTGVRGLLRELLDECDQARFAPILPDRTAMESAQERAASLIVAVDEAVASTRNGRTARANRAAILGLLITLLFPCALPVQAQDIPEAVRHFDEGNRLFREGAHRDAVTSYRNALEAGYASGALYYNMGNAYFRLDEIGQAIRFYEKARRYMPESEELAHNLAIVQNRTADSFSQLPAPFWRPAWNRLVGALSPTGIFLFGLLGYGMASAALAMRIRRTRSPWLRRTVLTGVVLAAFFVTSGFVASWEETHTVQAVMLADATDLTDRPDGAPTDLTVHEGAVVKVVTVRAAWSEVRLPNGVQGWVPTSAYGEI